MKSLSCLCIVTRRLRLNLCQQSCRVVNHSSSGYQDAPDSIKHHATNPCAVSRLRRCTTTRLTHHALSGALSCFLLSVLTTACSNHTLEDEEDQAPSQASNIPSDVPSEDDEASPGECPGYFLQRRNIESLDEVVSGQFTSNDFVQPLLESKPFRFEHRPIPEFEVHPVLDGHEARLQIEYKGGDIVYDAWTRIGEGSSTTHGDEPSAFGQPDCTNSLVIDVEVHLIVPELDLATRWQGWAHFDFQMNEALDFSTLQADVTTRDADVTASLEEKLIPTEPQVRPGDLLETFRWEQYILLTGSRLETYMLDAVWFVLLGNPNTDIPQATISRIFSAGPLTQTPVATAHLH